VLSEPALGETLLDTPTEVRKDLAQPESLGAAPRARGPLAVEQISDRAPAEPGEGHTPIPIVDATPSLDRTFAALARCERREDGARTRILFFGDSMVASDLGTGTLRRLLQKRFGDGGHGFVLAASAWPQYHHNDVFRQADKGFRVSRVVGPRLADKLYGLGGVSFSAPPGLRSWVGSAVDGAHGRRVSRFEVSYLEQPFGGTFDVRLDGKLVQTVETRGEVKRARTVEIRTSDGEHRLEVHTRTGTSRLFGFTLERDSPGVVLEAVGLVGARLRALDESDDAHFAEVLAWRRPDLVVYQFGANESVDGFAYPMSEYRKTMQAVLEKVKRAVPQAGCLVIGAMDRARRENGKLSTVPVIPHLVAEQKKVAALAGCAFYDAFEAMGGKGSMASWVRQGLGAGDYTHPTKWGAERLGSWMYSALMGGYEARGERKRGVPDAGRGALEGGDHGLPEEERRE
jgi:lysophospholipase L1-like esterase